AASLAPGPAEEGWLGVNRLLVELWMAGYPLKMSVLYPQAAGVQPTLPINIVLAPLSEPWPEPGELALARNGAGPPEAAPDRRPSAAPSPTAPIDRARCLAFAIGRAAEAFGPGFEEVDRLPSRVRLPDEPLMFVDRVLALEGRPLSLGPGRIVTEHEVGPDAWYLDQGHMPAGLAIEAGQADLMLSGWLGVDLATRGLAFYRLLDAEVTFHRELPRPGETARYDIRLVRFFKYGQTHLFRFEYDGLAGDRPLMTMRGGCAGFFTPAELAGGRGRPGGGLTEELPPPFVDPAAVGHFPGKLPGSLSAPALAALRAGDLAGAFGPGFSPNLSQAPTLPGGRLALLDRVTRLEPGGGRGRAGFIRAEIDIDPRAWFLTSHFPGDEVMPGTLMYESCLQTLRVFLMASGWVDEPGTADWQPVPGVAAALKCRGQVTARVKRAAYEVHVRRLEFKAPEGGGEPEPVALAEAVMLADDRPIVEVRNLNLRLRGSSAARLRRVWGRPGSPRPPAEDDPRTYNKARILALAEGRPSEALGPAFARFDDGAFLARLPRPPYDFLDQAAMIKGRRYEVEPGTEVLARYVVEADGWLFSEAGGVRPVLPYAVLNEIALQPCGFLASYMGSALPFDSPMHFRNLGGRATVLAEVAGGEAVDTRARFVRDSRLGEMIIQHYEFECAVGSRPVYQGVTHFGFFSPEALARQAGLAGVSSAGWPARPEADALRSYPQGPVFPTGKWRLVEKIALDPRGGPEGLGSAFAVTRVDPQAWFFRAHFYQDPVCPGSLGLESLLQAGKALAVHIFGASEGKAWGWAAPALHQTHEWLYRGQVTPAKKEMAVKLVVRAADPARRLLTVDGLLLTDDLPIYKMEGFTIGLDPGPVRRRVVAPPKPARSRARSVGAITSEMILDWRKANNLSQGQLARLMGVTPIYISLMERGKRNVSPPMAEKFMAVFQSASAETAADQDAPPSRQGGLSSRREGHALGLLRPEDLRARRQARGLSQRKLAEEVGVTATLIGLIELGKRGLSQELAQKILAALQQ
ncbi:MAG: helix-turn-helix domain-containing protein, partial [Candidatus Adiutrix sp.]|nr:helix-turn-helix domain-containing protein [Candidatus Adiutrix sp.]